MSTAPKADLKKFFNPASVALVGATDDLSRFAGKVLMRMTDFGYKGKIYPVNPRFKGQKVRGFECYASVRDLPEALHPLARRRRLAQGIARLDRPHLGHVVVPREGNGAGRRCP